MEAKNDEIVKLTKRGLPDMRYKTNKALFVAARELHKRQLVTEEEYRRFMKAFSRIVSDLKSEHVLTNAEDIENFMKLVLDSAASRPVNKFDNLRSLEGGVFDMNALINFLNAPGRAADTDALYAFFNTQTTKATPTPQKMLDLAGSVYSRLEAMNIENAEEVFMSVESVAFVARKIVGSPQTAEEVCARSLSALSAKEEERAEEVEYEIVRGILKPHLPKSPVEPPAASITVPTDVFDKLFHELMKALIKARDLLFGVMKHQEYATYFGACFEDVGAFVTGILKELSLWPKKLSKSEKKKKKVLVIVTGGTITCVESPDGEGLIPENGIIESRLAGCAELSHEGMPGVDILEWQKAFFVDSSDARKEFLSKLAAQLEFYHNSTDEATAYDGFVVVMGTDTLAYVSSAISFMISNLKKPIVFTGSMLPLINPISDGRRNLLLSIFTAGALAGDVTNPEVLIAFDSKLMSAVRAIKFDCLNMDAFASPRAESLTVYGDVLEAYKAWAQRRLAAEVPAGVPTKCTALLGLFDDIVNIHITPMTSVAMLDEMLESKSISEKAFIFSFYGTGNTSRVVKARIDKFVARSRAVVGIIQSVKGRIDDAYEASAFRRRPNGGKQLISGQDMTLEACTTKLAVGLAKYGDNEYAQLVTYMAENARGELTSLGGNVL